MCEASREWESLLTESEGPGCTVDAPSDVSMVDA